MARRQVVYMYSLEYIQQCNNMLRIPNRAEMVHSLIEAFGLLKYTRIVAPCRAPETEILRFHSDDYIKYLQKLNVVEDEEKYDEESETYGLSYDCPGYVGVYDYAVLVAGATITAAEMLLDRTCDVAINWFGGWHHAKRDTASGFCYVNDIVIGILKLREQFDKVLYIDLDLHHGDGTEDAFCTTSKVLTVSIHKFSTGFFPGSGSIDDTGIGKGKFYTINVPLKDGIQDANFVSLFVRILSRVKETYRPDAIVCQCGADGLAGDPMESFNLTHNALGHCIQLLLSWRLPLLLLGGGGYNHSNTAKCWAYLTSLAVGKKLPEDIPDHKFLMEYGPDYHMSSSIGNRKDSNTREYLKGVCEQVFKNLDNLKTLQSSDRTKDCAK